MSAAEAKSTVGAFPFGLPVSKWCTRCGEAKLVDEFHKHKLGALGRDSRCKACFAAIDAAYKAKPGYKARAREVSLERYRRPEVRARMRETGREWQRRTGRDTSRDSPAEGFARRLIRNAVQRGALVRGPCEVCGREQSHGHHDDYNRPFDIRWLCSTHHAEWHRNNEPKRAPWPPIDLENVRLAVKMRMLPADAIASLKSSR
jgi:uncharacterized protein (DUF983 family)